MLLTIGACRGAVSRARDRPAEPARPVTAATAADASLARMLLRPVCILALAAGILAGMLPLAHAADPERGAQLFSTPPRQGLLACIDCHGENPQANNFGNIWSGRNAPALIERAIGLNTGGMGVFQGLYGAAEVTDIAAFLGNLPRRLSFADTAVGQTSAVQRVTVASSTKAAMTGLRLQAAGDYRITASDCGASLERFSSCTIDLRFEPTAAGARPGTLVIAHDGSGTPVQLPLSAQGLPPPPPRARLTPERLDFGSTPVQQDGALRVAWLHNDDSVPLRLNTLETRGDDFVHAGGSCLPNQLLAPGASCTITLRFMPRSAGDRSGQLVVDLRGQSFSVALRGVASAGPAPRLTMTPPLLDFGTWPQPMTSTSQRVTLRNTGQAAALLQTLRSTAAEFVIERSDCGVGTTLAPGQACTVQLALQAPRAAAFSASLEVGVAGQPAQRFPLSGRVGTVAAPASPSPSTAASTGALAIDANQLDFGEVVLGANTPAQTLTVRNLGSTALQWSAVDLSGAAASQFEVQGDCSTTVTLQPGASCSLQWIPRLRSAGLHSASLLLWPAGATTPAVVTLSARGVTTAPLPAPAWPEPAPGALRWTALTASDATATALVGSRIAAARWLLQNTAAVDSAPLRWALGGPHASDFEVDAGSSCRNGQVLPAQASCTLQFVFQPTAAGPRQAHLGLVAGSERAAPVGIAGRGMAPPLAQARWQPQAVTFAAAASGAAPEALPLWLHNSGAQVLALTLQSPAGVGVTLAADDGAEACELAGPTLEPGGRCRVLVRWNRDAALAAGAIVSVGGDASATLPISVSEDPALTSNQGQGGGAFGVVAGLALLLASVALRRRSPRRMT